MEKELLLSSKETELLNQLSIGVVVLFGSRAQGLSGIMSDFDFGVILKDKSQSFFEKKRKEIYDTIYDIFSSKIKKLVNIDIVFLESAPFELRSHVVKYGKVLFEADSKVFSDFKEKVMEQYSDFGPLRRVFQDGVLSQV